jgi:small redox-active disulfide protein 2
MTAAMDGLYASHSRLEQGNDMMKRIKILGTGCPKCAKLAENAEAAAEALGIEFEIEKVTNVNEIARLGVMLTPGLVVDGDVKSSGRVLDVDRIKALLAE